MARSTCKQLSNFEAISRVVARETHRVAASQGCQRQISCVHGAGDRGQPCYVACSASQFRAELLPRGAIAPRGDITNLRAHTFPRDTHS